MFRKTARVLVAGERSVLHEKEVRKDFFLFPSAYICTLAKTIKNTPRLHEVGLGVFSICLP